MVTERGGRTFDWRARFDPRSLDYRAAAEAQTLPATGLLWEHGPVLDQGREGACVGFGSSGAVAAAPAGHPGVNDRYALNWYHRAQRLDDYPGEAYEGTSVLAGCLVGRERKLWTGFRWAKGPAELAAGILQPTLGPAVVGVMWSDDLYEPPVSGLLPGNVELDPQLGHCVLLFGYVPAPGRGRASLWADLEEQGLADAVQDCGEPCFLLLNSWGEAWGVHGAAVAPLTLVQRWFRARGEFALPEGRTQKGTRAAMEPNTEENQDEAPPAAGDVTLHLTAVEVQEGDRILDPPEEVGQESVTVRGTPKQVTGWGGRRVVLSTTAGTFQLGAGDAVTVRRPE
jgi:hypothetical protein